MMNASGANNALNIFSSDQVPCGSQPNQRPVTYSIRRPAIQEFVGQRHKARKAIIIAATLMANRIPSDAPAAAASTKFADLSSTWICTCPSVRGDSVSGTINLAINNAAGAEITGRSHQVTRIDSHGDVSSHDAPGNGGKSTDHHGV